MIYIDKHFEFSRLFATIRVVDIFMDEYKNYGKVWPVFHVALHTAPGAVAICFTLPFIKFGFGFRYKI